MMNEMIEINAGSLTYSALIELLHGNHVAQKHILAEYWTGSADVTITVSRLEEIRGTGDKLIDAWVQAKENNRNERIF
jgi:hypothetical protein|tara:strand:- start:6440 stop:6673 length:234 start_codon:yes stop_codon:yes gene_type:complete